MKRKIALFIAATMLMTSLPMSALASSSNNVTKVPAQKTDAKLDNPLTAPKLKITMKDDYKTTDGAFRLTLENAEFLGSFFNQTVEVLDKDNKFKGSMKVTKLTDTMCEVEILAGTAATTAVADAEAKLVQAQAAKTVADNALAAAKTANAGAQDALEAKEAQLATAKSALESKKSDEATAQGDYDTAKAASDAAWVAFAPYQKQYAAFGTAATKLGAATELTQVQYNLMTAEEKAAVNFVASTNTSLTTVPTFPLAIVKADITASKTVFVGFASDLDGTKSAVTKYSEAETAVTDADADVATEKVTLDTAKAATVAAQKVVTDLEAEVATAKAATGSVTTAQAAADAAALAVVEAQAQVDAAQAAVANPIVLVKDDWFEIDLLTEVTGSTGEDAKVTISPKNTPVSSGTFSFATVGAKSVKTTITEETNIEDARTEIAEIFIDEVITGSVDFASGKYIELRLPSQFKLDETQAKIKWDGKYLTAGTDFDMAHPKDESGSSIDNIVKITFKGATQASMRADRASLEELFIEGLAVTPRSSAKYGTVEMTVGGTALPNSTTLKVGEYKDYVMSFKAADKPLPTIYAGFVPDANTTNKKNVVLQVTLKEELENAWAIGKKTQFVFPEGIKIVNVRTADDATKATNIYTKDPLNASAEGQEWLYGDVKGAIDGNTYTLSGANIVKDKLGKVVLQFVVSAEADFEGDVVLEVKGGAVGGQELKATVAKVVKPVAVTTGVNDIEIGYKSIDAHNITIKENGPAIWKDGSHIRLAIGDRTTNDTKYMNFGAKPTVKVVEGDAEIGTVKVTDGVIDIEVKYQSSKPTTLEVSGIKLNIDRTPPEGQYALSYYGTSIITNGDEDATKTQLEDQGYFTTEEYVLPGVFNVVTPATNSTSQTRSEAFITFVDGYSDTMVVGDKEYKVDSYIQNDKTLVSLRYAAYALGVPANAVGWDSVTRTASIKTANGIASVVVGGYGVEPDATLYLNGIPFSTMQQPAIIINDLTYIPVADFAKALNISYLWDQDTKTVVFNPTKETIAKYPNAYVSLASDQQATVVQVEKDATEVDVVSSETTTAAAETTTATETTTAAQ